jgi:metal-sulfur cluster biosynthetic enzyme
MAENKFPSELVDLPSKGRLYPKDSPLSSGKIEIKYMTAKEEDILTSQNLIKKGVVIDFLLESLIVDKNIKLKDLILGDKNAIMVASRILAYGPEYTAEISHPVSGQTITHTFNLAECPFVEISEDIKENIFSVELPVSKAKIEFKILTGYEEEKISKETESRKKLGSQISSELTTRLKHTIISVNGDSDFSTINTFVDNMLSKDSLFLRREIIKVSPDIELTQEIQIEGDTVQVDIPMTANFFWPTTR